MPVECKEYLKKKSDEEEEQLYIEQNDKLLNRNMSMNTMN